MKKYFQWSLIVSLHLFCISAEARIYIPIDQSSDQKFPIAVCDLADGSGIAKEIPEIIRHDLELSGYFNVLPASAFQKAASREGITTDSIKFNFWASIEAQAIVKGGVESKGGKYVATLRLFDPYVQEMLVGKQYTFSKKEIREVSHRFSDEIMEALTGIRGVFNSKIVYAAAVSKGRKEIFVMDMDGENAYRVTNLKSLTLSPALSPNGREIAFTSYVRGNPDLYAVQVDGKGLRSLVTGPGSKLTPAWSPDGSRIAFSSSMDGDSDIYIMSSKGGKVTKTTNSRGIAISPTWSPDGNSIMFASDSAGGLHIFESSSSGGGLHRLTFVGYQNDMPSWSPMGDKIAFSGRDMGSFDIFIMNPDGSSIERLTIASGNNEHPSWSPDGRFIVFSSTREGETAIYMMRADGSNQTRISKGNGMLPRWSSRIE